jgi:hypothetical protein
MKLGRTSIAVLATAALAALAASSGVAATGDDVARSPSGVQLELPEGWAKLSPAVDRLDDPRTMLVIGTEGARAIQSPCQVSSYRVPADGAVVVVIGWKDAVGGTGFLPLSGLKLRRGTFECFDGRGAVARVTRRDRDFQVNVMVGDRAEPGTIAAALEAARSFVFAPRL